MHSEAKAKRVQSARSKSPRSESAGFSEVSAGSRYNLAENECYERGGHRYSSREGIVSIARELHVGTLGGSLDTRSRAEGRREKGRKVGETKRETEQSAPRRRRDEEEGGGGQERWEDKKRLRRRKKGK